MSYSQELGAIVRDRRLHLGWSQGDLAARAGTARSCISRIEHGHHTPTARTVLKLAGLLSADLPMPPKRPPQLPQEPAAIPQDAIDQMAKVLRFMFATSATAGRNYLQDAETVLRAAREIDPRTAAD